ncbi:MAG: response regulator transcription factor [Planctomycetia bacterium]|nr:response regulator transcription factor [Planctomycetia bacterium]
MSDERILIVEDEQAIGDLIVYHLNREGYHQTLHVLTGEEALREVNSFHPNLILLDLMLPGMSGMDVCRRLKSDPSAASIPIIFLTAKSEESDIVVGLEMGADDYITKPFSNRLLIARMRSLLRRAAQTSPDESESFVKAGPIQMNLLSRQVRIDGNPVEFTVSEFNLLHLLVSNKDRVFTRNQLVMELRGDDYPVTERAMDVLVLGVRRKLKDHSVMIETIRGVGYRFTEK